ncbi:hypothetical protein F4604DRAFT_2746 [Suillus subluteus]|nr:hypothetical protein F4604DRAFT_2746 [Suillus subluteus]
MSHPHAIRMLLNYLKVFLKVLCRYIAFPLRLVHLCRTLLQLYSRNVASIMRLDQFQRVHTDGHPERISGSSLSLLPLSNNHVPSLLGPAASNPSIPMLLINAPLTSANPNDQQLPLAAPIISQSQSEFWPFTPSQVMRYNKNPRMHKQESKILIIPPVKREYSDTEDSGDWCTCVHPDGALYFHDPIRGIYTDSNIWNETRRSSMTSRIEKLLALMTSRCGLQLRSGGIELVVELTKGRDHHRVCRYYFVDHPNRLLFWLDEMPTAKIFDGVLGVEKWSHIKYAIQHQYWQHCELYPSDKLPGPQLLKELKEVVVHASAEIITTDLSLSPFDSDELSKILHLIDRFEDDIQGAHYTCVIVRFMRYFSRAQFFNFCGLPEARLNAGQPLFVKEKKSKFLVALSWAINFALLDAPQYHMTALQRVWVDHRISPSRWKNFYNKLMDDWSSVAMYSTVLLAVDISFLSVPSVSLQKSGSVTTVSIYFSIFCTVGSLVVSLCLTRQHRLYGQESADTAAQFLTKVARSAFGTRSVATVHGLPYVMLLWGMMYFILAFSYQVLMSTPTWTLAFTGSACGLLFVLWLASVMRDFYLLTWLLAWLKAWIRLRHGPDNDTT